MNKTLLTLALGLTLALTVTTAQASPITLSIGDPYYIGKVSPGSPANLSDEAGYLNFLLDMAVSSTTAYNPLPNPPNTTWTYTRSALACGSIGTCVDATATGAIKPSLADVTNLDLSLWTYISAKYGNESYFWYVAGQTDVTLVTPLGGGEDQGLSHYSLFNPLTPTPGQQSVPDGGATLVMLSVAIAGLGYARQKFAV